VREKRKPNPDRENNLEDFKPKVFTQVIRKLDARTDRDKERKVRGKKKETRTQ